MVELEHMRSIWDMEDDERVRFVPPKQAPFHALYTSDEVQQHTVRADAVGPALQRVSAVGAVSTGPPRQRRPGHPRPPVDWG